MLKARWSCWQQWKEIRRVAVCSFDSIVVNVSRSRMSEMSQSELLVVIISWAYWLAVSNSFWILDEE